MVHRSDQSMIITTSDFTDAARRLAKGAPIELWSRRDLHNAVDPFRL
ncbi:MAG: restriction endonuclease [Candidatus Bathyarchaeia archaeon]